MRFIAALAAVIACGHPSAPDQSLMPKRGPTTVTHPRFPNVHAQLRLTQLQPGSPQRDIDVEIWLKDSRFRVRDLAGRRFEEIEADLTAPRGLGAPARSIEDFMDRSAAARRPAKAPTELFGDMETGEGWVVRQNAEPRSQAAADMVAAAEQILAKGKDLGLQRAGIIQLLGRQANEFRGTVAVTEDGTEYHNNVYRVVSAPYLLIEELSDKDIPDLAYRREVLSLDEGSVSDSDMRTR